MVKAPIFGFFPTEKIMTFYKITKFLLLQERNGFMQIHICGPASERAWCFQFPGHFPLFFSFGVGQGVVVGGSLRLVSDYGGPWKDQ